MKAFLAKINKYLIKDTKLQIQESIKKSNNNLSFPYLFFGSLIMYCYISGPVVQHYKNRKYILAKRNLMN